MNDLLKKLNTLIQAGINDVMEDAQKAVSEPLKNIPGARLGKGIEGEVAALRKKVNDALAYEDELLERIGQLQQEVEQLDREADEAVAANNDGQARYLVERLTRAQQRLTMTEADLNAHRLVTQELITRVNELDAAVADARHAEAQNAVDDKEKANAEAPQTAVPQPTQESATKTPETAQEVVERMQAFNEKANKMISDVLRDAREKINQMDELIESSEEVKVEVEKSVTDEVEATLSKDAINDDIAARRSRLAGPPKPGAADDATPSE